jgi:TolA-binding protein
VSATPAQGQPSLADEELLALARTLPEPVLTEASREEMRTAFLATVRGLRSGARAGSAAMRAMRRRRLILIGTIVVAGAGAAAAAWRINRPSSPARLPPVQNRAGTDLAGTATAVPLPSPVPPPESAPALPEKAPERRASAARKLASVGHRAETSSGGDAEIAFARGWSALRTGDFSIAATAFGRVSSAKDTTLAADALFWRGVALDRAGRFEPARQALAEFLARYPDSDRKGEASVILGWLLVRAGELGDARERFTRALDDPAERVRGSARSGLAAVGEASP